MRSNIDFIFLSIKTLTLVPDKIKSFKKREYKIKSPIPCSAQILTDFDNFKFHLKPDNSLTLF